MKVRQFTIHSSSTDKMSEVKVEGLRQVEIFLCKESRALAQLEEITQSTQWYSFIIRELRDTEWKMGGIEKYLHFTQMNLYK